MTTNRDWSVSYKGVVGIASCVLGLGVVYFGYGIGTESPKKDAVAKVNTVEPRNSQRPVRAMNLALGNMVFFARDLGFAVKSVKEGVDASAVASRIESQLIGIREMYRQEVAKNPALAGALVLQFNVNPEGEVSQVRELSSRVSDGEFKKAVISETSKWSFDQVVSESLEVTCPLLFVQEGMDITTLLQWEKTLGNYPSDANALPERQAKAAQTSAPAAAAPSTQRAAAKSESKEFQLRYATSLRKYPNFSSVTLTTLTIGTKVTVLGKQGDWLEVRSTGNGPTGFIRKEFVTPSDVARK